MMAADWQVSLPGTVHTGDDGHAALHNAELNGLRELRSLVDSGALDGNPGTKGAKGAKGADGFPTEADWNDLVARVEALESGG